MFQPGPSEPVRLVMQPLSSASSLRQARSVEEAQVPDTLPPRWHAAVQNLEAAQAHADTLARFLDDALYLDTQDWQQAVPASQQHHAKLVLQRRISGLEAQLGDCRSRLASSEAARQTSAGRVAELETELENNARVFQLHYEALLDKEQTISDLQAVISALSLGTSGDEVSGGGG